RAALGVRQEFGPDVLQHDVQIDIAWPRAQAAEPQLQMQLPEARTTPPGSLGVNNLHTYLVPLLAQAVGQQLDVARQPDTVDLTDDANPVRS
ncbi:MAG TPA: hypothetical protein VNR40_10755, partial [Steroidobacter sp.]|nr:hypothetical protein [Steroidobacter sp.]